MVHALSVWLITYGTWAYLFTPIILMAVIQQEFLKGGDMGKKCPKAYDDKIAAMFAAESIGRKSRGKQEPAPYQCGVCKKWHIKESK